MKYGQYLKDNISPEFGETPYLDYSHLKKIIHQLSEVTPAQVEEKHRQVSLTTPSAALDQHAGTEEIFVKKLDTEIRKIEAFTLKKVTELRKILDTFESSSLLQGLDLSQKESVALVKQEADGLADKFLHLEKYVNLQFLGFHKILKKHDKHVPNNPIRTFYITRLHAQAWVRGDYSDVVVRLSSIYSLLRNDQVAQENQDASQSFLRSTSKYWVKTEDVSRVKYAILKHLPVFLQKSSTGESDSQFTNSVYIDNAQLELYHGRLDKTPGAIALRLRWYGTGDPTLVFVERKTHRDKWTGEVSVKERFIITEKEVQQVLNTTYPVEKLKREMIEKKGKSQQDADDWEELVMEITQIIQAKQLVPTMRTQCMRTAFQIPFDATVRISLDTNLCMISERGYDTENGKVWHRDKSSILKDNEITRFPHAILEIKLEVNESSSGAPEWVRELQNSGLIYEVHKYSKFIHGCSVLLPDDVQSVPYWIDDASIRSSIIVSGGEKLLVPENVGVGQGANAIYSHFLPFGDTRNDRRATAVGRTAQSDPMENTKQELVNVYSSEEGEGDELCDLLCSPSDNYAGDVMAPTRLQKIEPKIFFANERTFLHYVHFGVTLFTIASGILAFSAETDDQLWSPHVYAMALLVVALGFCVYALYVFLRRAERIKSRVPGRWDDPQGPILLGSILAIIMSVSFIVKVYVIATFEPEL